MSISLSAALRFVSTMAAVTTSVACLDSLNNPRHTKNILKNITKQLQKAKIPSAPGHILESNYSAPQQSRLKRSHVAIGLIGAALIGGGMHPWAYRPLKPSPSLV